MLLAFLNCLMGSLLADGLAEGNVPQTLRRLWVEANPNARSLAHPFEVIIT